MRDCYIVCAACTTPSPVKPRRRGLPVKPIYLTQNDVLEGFVYSPEEDFGAVIARLREFQDRHGVVEGLSDEPEDLPAGPIPNIHAPTENDDGPGRTSSCSRT